MNIDTGRILPLAAVAAMTRAERVRHIPAKTVLTAEQRRAMRVGRNDQCPCGSGRKFKRCHLNGPDAPVGEIP
jgi:uncharacterized protein YecA (UPF0149 family)